MRRTGAAWLLVALALSAGGPAQAAARAAETSTPALADDPSSDLTALTAGLARVTADARALAARLDEAAARDGGLRARADDLAEAQAQARDTFDARVRTVYIAQLTQRSTVLDELGLTASRDRALLDAAAHGSLTVDRQLVEAVSQRSAESRALRAEAATYREGLLAQATGVLTAQDRARALLAQAEAAENRQLAQRQSRTRQETSAAETSTLSSFRVQLDAVSATVTAALTPAQTVRTRAAARDQGPVLALLVAAGSGYPQGYARTGQTVAGDATWYGPGFVGSPTASGAPYDPELLTCAHKTLPLGTVLHVTRGVLAVNCLVNDRGPYVGARVLDLSRAGSRALAYDGVAQVVAEVLAPA